MESIQHKKLLQKALEKAASYCAYQERSELEVVEKLGKFDLSQKENHEIIQYLKDEGFLDEKRFADAFVRGKFLYKGWGKLKIKQGLRQKGVDSSTAEEALNSLPEEEYVQALEKELSKKYRQLSSEKDRWKLKQKLYRFAVSRGFEPSLIGECLDKLI